MKTMSLIVFALVSVFLFLGFNFYKFTEDYYGIAWSDAPHRSFADRKIGLSFEYADELASRKGMKLSYMNVLSDVQDSGHFRSRIEFVFQDDFPFYDRPLYEDSDPDYRMFKITRDGRTGQSTKKREWRITKWPLGMKPQVSRRPIKIVEIESSYQSVIEAFNLRFSDILTEHPSFFIHLISLQPRDQHNDSWTINGYAPGNASLSGRVVEIYSEFTAIGAMPVHSRIMGDPGSISRWEKLQIR